MPHENSIYIQFSNGLLLYVLSFQRSISPTQERTCKYIFIYCLCKTKVGNSLCLNITSIHHRMLMHYGRRKFGFSACDLSVSKWIGG